MKKLIILSLFLIAGNSCKDARCAITQVTELRLANNPIAGWVENQERYATFDTATFYNLIDGGAPAYIEQGLLDGFTQFFVNVMEPDTFNCKLYVMDFGSTVNVRYMFDKIKSEQTMPVAIPGFDTSVAMASEFLGGYFAFAIFDRFYIEVSVSGYYDLALALHDAQAFINIFKSKIPIPEVAAKGFSDRRKETSSKKLNGCPAFDLRGRRLPLTPNQSPTAIVDQNKKVRIVGNKIMVK